MPNPTITAYATAGTPYTVAQSDYAYYDLQLSSLSDGAEFLLACPADAQVHVWTLHTGEVVLRWLPDPADVRQLLGGGAWASVVTIGGWEISVAAGGTTVVTVSNTGAGPNAGPLRVRISNLLVNPANTCTLTAQSNAGTQRVVADPSISGTPPAAGSQAPEKSTYTLTANVAASQVAAAAVPAVFGPLPSIVASWSRQPSELAFSLTPVGTNAEFQAPGVYEDTDVGFDLRAFYDLNVSGVYAPAVDPSNETAIVVSIVRVKQRMLLLLDRSGSMGRSLPEATTPVSRWDAAVRAAHAWLDLFFAFRGGPQQKVGILTFEHDPCGWGVAAASDDITLRNPASGAVATSLADVSTLANLSSLTLGGPQSCTPIGDALEKAFQVLNGPTPPSAATEHCTIVLLTDGFENSGFTTIQNALVPGSTKTFAGNVRTAYPAVNQNLSLYTFAVGTGVDEDTLNNLPSLIGSGSNSGGYYRLTRDTAEILPVLAQMIGDSIEAQDLGAAIGVNMATFVSNTGERKIAVIVPWANVTDTLRVSHRAVGGTIWNILPTGAGTGTQIFQRTTHGMAVVDLAPALELAPGSPVPAQEWKVERLVAGAPAAIESVLAMVDLHLKIEVDFDQAEYRTNEPIVVRARVRKGNQPVKNANITVQLDAPGQGLGTFLAVNGGKRFGSVPISQLGQVATTAHRFDGDKLNGMSVAVGNLGGPSAGDTPSLKGLLFRGLLAEQQLADLPLVTPPPLFSDGTSRLFDDGAHQDGPADDGDYANVFVRTYAEGTYTFRVRATGTLDDGSPFQRVVTISKWVGIKPAPSTSPVTLEALASPGPGLFAAWVQVQPKDLRGEYLGPFREAEVEFQTSAGYFEGEIIGTTDGIYRRKLRYKEGEMPVVQVTAAGTPLKPILTFDPEFCLSIDELCRHGQDCREHFLGLLQAFRHLKGLFNCCATFKRALERLLRAWGQRCRCGTSKADPYPASSAMPSPAAPPPTPHPPHYKA